MSKLGGARRRSQLRSTVSPSLGGGIGISRRYEGHRPVLGITRCAGGFREPPKVADAASELRPDVLKDKKGLAAWCMALQSLQFDTFVELEDS